MPNPLRHPRTIVWVALLLILACSSPEERFAEHVSRAESYASEGRPDDALIELQSALKIDPSDPDVNQQLAELLRSRGSVQAAAFHFGEAYRLDPSRVHSAIQQALLIWRTAPGRARQIIAGVKQRFPDDPSVYRGEANLAIAMKENAQAVQAAQKATELAPDDPDNWATLGAVYVELIREARKQDQEQSPADFEAGIAAFERVDALTEGHIHARIEKAMLLGRSGRGDRAVETFRSAIRLANERDKQGGAVMASRRFAGYARMVGSTDLEIEALRGLANAAPESVRQWDALSRAVARRDGPEAAESIYLELIEQRPELPAAHVAYAGFLARRGRALDAIAHIDRSIAGGVDDPALWEQLVRLELAGRRIADARATLAEMKSRHPEHPTMRRTEARLAIRENRVDAALEILSELDGPNQTAETELLRASAERSRGDLEAAALAAKRAVALAPRQDATALRLQASIQADAGSWQGVIRSLERLRARGHATTGMEEVLEARAHYELGDAAKGRAVLEAVLQRAAPPPAAAVEFARRVKDRPADARRHLARALRVSPGNYAALSAMTKLDLMEGRGQQALRRLDRLVEAQLAGPRVLLLRSQVLLHAGQLDRAEADALRAFEAIPELTDAVDMLFAIYTAQNKVDEAARSFEEADSVGVLHKGARVLLARLYVTQGKEDAALALYEKVLEEDDQLVSAQHDLARLLAKRGADLRRALELAKQAQRAMPDDPAIADTLGFIQLQLGQHEQALKQFESSLELAQAMDIAPPAVHYHLGLTLVELGRNREAVSAFEQALEIDPQFQGADDARAQLEAARETAATGSS